MRILGIDPGTVSFDLCLLEDREIRFEDSIPSTVVAERPEDMAAAMEFVLEGLHLNKRLNKTRRDGKTVYRN